MPKLRQNIPWMTQKKKLNAMCRCELKTKGKLNVKIVFKGMEHNKKESSLFHCGSCSVPCADVPTSEMDNGGEKVWRECSKGDQRKE